jgi:hypothetical protein
MAIDGTSWIPVILAPLPPVEVHTPPETFLDFIHTLDEWERELVPGLSMDVNCFEFLDIVNSQDKTNDATQLITVSDGSDDSGSMSFGWIIALPTGRCLA